MMTNDLANAIRQAVVAMEAADKVADRRGYRRAVDAKSAAQRELRNRFAKARGWAATRRPFSVRQLVARTNGRRRDEHMPYGEALFDHASYYRLVESPWTPAGIAAHLYGVPADLHERAAALGLSAEVMTDFPSWYYPGVTQLVVYTPASTEQASLAHGLASDNAPLHDAPGELEALEA